MPALAEMQLVKSVVYDALRIELARADAVRPPNQISLLALPRIGHR
jgi:hypothetical protein